MVHAVRVLASAASADFDVLDQDERLQAFARQAYALLCSWFGRPQGDDRSWRLILCRYTALPRISGGRYSILIASSISAHNRRCAAIAHEMCYVVTGDKRPALRRENAWLDEALAFLATQHVLRDQGLDVEADEALCRVYGARAKMDMPELARARGANRWALFREAPPPGFYAGAALAGLRLEALVRWPGICNLVWCHSWQEWLDLLPSDVRERAADWVSHLTP